MTLDQIFLIVKLVALAGAGGYILFLYLSRKKLKDEVEKKGKTIALRDKEIQLMKTNIEKLKKYAKKKEEIQQETDEVIAIIEDEEISEDEKDKAISDMLTSFMAGN